MTENGLHDPVLSAFAPVQEVFQWHQDGISLPPDVDVLASSPASPVQAFRHGEHVYGFQFHLEVDSPLIERWLTVPAHRETLEEERGRVDANAVRRQTTTSIGPLERLSRETFLRWIDRFEIGPRVQRLPSR
jgi:GMP synthase (glutamine-hydrolysing)